MKKSIKILCLVCVLLFSLCGCGNDSNEDIVTEYKIVSAKYTSLVDGVFNKELEETLVITYINKDGERITDTTDPSWQLSFGEENKVVYTNEDSFWGYKRYVLTQETYNKIVSSSPMVVNVDEKDGADNE